jgi:hypothetical protein
VIPGSAIKVPVDPESRNLTVVLPAQRNRAGGGEICTE